MARGRYWPLFNLAGVRYWSLSALSCVCSFTIIMRCRVMMVVFIHLEVPVLPWSVVSMSMPAVKSVEVWLNDACC